MAFPDPAELANLISSTEVGPNLTVQDLVAGLQADPTRLKKYEDVEDLAIQASDNPGSEADDLAERMLPVRNEIASQLRSRELLVAFEIIDHLLFQALREPAEGPAVQQVFETLRNARVDAAGFVVFAVHSLGLTAEDLPSLRGGLEIIDSDWGIAVRSQTNSLDETIDFLDRVRESFGVDGVLPVDSIRHWRRSRQTTWLELNPLLCVRVAEAAGTYYGNEPLLLARLQVATAFVAMLAALQSPAQGENRPVLSTWVLNNQQTLDIHHYLVLSPGRAGGDSLAGDCVPISRSRPDVVAMSELRIDRDADYWSTRSDEARRVAAAVASIYRSYLRHGFDPSRDDDQAREARRRFDSLAYFQRSLSGQGWRDIITLSTAFELLLHDPTARNTSKRIRNTIKRLFPGSSEGLQHADAFGRVYRARGEIVHEGARVTSLNLEEARRAYVAAFVRHVETQPLD